MTVVGSGVRLSTSAGSVRRSARTAKLIKMPATLARTPTSWGVRCAVRRVVPDSPAAVVGAYCRSASCFSEPAGQRARERSIP